MVFSRSLTNFVRNEVIPIVLSMQLLIGVLQLLDILHPKYYPLIHGITMSSIFELEFSLKLPLEFLLFLWSAFMVNKTPWKVFLFPGSAIMLFPFLGLELSLVLATLLAVAVSLFYLKCYDGIFLWILFILSVFEGFVLLHWIVFIPFDLASPFLLLSEIETGVFYVLGNYVPLLVLPMFFMWLLKPVILWGFENQEKPEFIIPKNDIKSFTWIILLFLLTFIGFLSVLYPYFSAVNPEGRQIGVDFSYYVRGIDIIQDDFSQAFTLSKGSRPIVYLVLIGFQRIFNLNAVNAVKLFPALLVPVLILSVATLVLEISGNWKTALFAGFFTLCSYHVTSGMYAYFLSNMLGLSVLFFSLMFLIRALQRRSISSLIIASLLGILVLFIHPWTLVQYIVGIICTTFLLGYRVYIKREDPNDFYFIISYLGFLVFSELIKILIFQGRSGISATYSTIQGIAHIPKFWYSSIFTFKILYGGSMSIFLLFILVILGMLVIKTSPIVDSILLFFTFFTSLVFLVGNEVIKSRLMFNFPLGLYAAFGVVWLTERKSLSRIKPVIISFILLTSLVYLFRTFANLI